MARPRRLTDVELLIEANTFLIDKVLNFNRARFPRIDETELRSDGMVGLWKAAESYAKYHDLSDLEGFEKYAYVIIHRSMVDCIRKHWGRTRGEWAPNGKLYWKQTQTSLNVHVSVHDESVELIDTLASIEVGFSNRDLVAWIKEFNSLRDRTILFFRFFMDWTLEEIGDWCGVSQFAIAKRLKTILDNERRGIVTETQETVEVKSDLSDRQREVLELCAEGLGSKEIGRRLFLSEETVKSHRKEIIRKLKAENLINAVAIGFREGLLV